ncbi:MULTISPECIES: hypothetical protein [Sinorhizobium]|nr:hypothetical protein U8C39_22255 [Sinorhizobium meliloti]WQP21724.1 hypothetical protein U8C33_22380 [Sinorhizobium meliloti]WQP35140.1 hypothetical protein U8C45_22215 [Sinorhizobium meliloti]
MASNYLLDNERVVRLASWAKLRKDEDDNVVGVLPQAFHLRDDEEYLSVTWCEYFAGSPDEQARCAVEAVRNSKLKVGSKARFVFGTVGNIRAAAESRPVAPKLRFIHEPEEDNVAHTAIRRWPREDHELFDLLAEEAWSNLVDAVAADQLPTCDCSASERA